MRRFRLSRILPSSLVALCCLLIFFHALFRFNFHWDVETRFFKHPPTGPQAKPKFHPDRPWFMRGGRIRPKEAGPKFGGPALWPHESATDRIENQLMYIPHGYGNGSGIRPKTILLFHGRRGWSDLPLGGTVFKRDRCPVQACSITISHRDKADLVLFKDRYAPAASVDLERTPEQIWMLFLLECPLHTQSFSGAGGLFNWTASYRQDSDVVAPYEKWVPYPSSSAFEDLVSPAPSKHKDYAYGKTRQVAWFVSNCAARNGRLQYARELSKYIGVDLFGRCSKGPRSCPRSNAHGCFRMLSREYKFYLAFENSNCRDYITEKFFVNGLGHDVIPIVMGARPEDYARVAPPHSYIHVEDFNGPAHLAEYLKLLDSNVTLYNAYFDWKGTGEFINTRFWCRLCALLHAPVVPKVYTDIETWWAGKGTCTSDQWRAPTTTSKSNIDTPIESR